MRQFFATTIEVASTLTSFLLGENREHEGHVGDAATHRPRAVLARAYWDDTSRGHDAHRRLEAGDAVDRCGTDDGSVGLGAQGEWGETRRRGGARSR